jgi:L-asparaginase / beta-aspartyl-peptidase
MKIFTICRNKFFPFLILMLLLSKTSFSQEDNFRYTIVVHGGAGYIDPNIEESLKDAYLNSLTEALNIGKKILEQGGSSLDAVAQVVKFLEDDSLFNAARGAVLTSEGKAELDASIMDGKDLSSGAVASVKTIKNPILLARLVMENTPHVLFAGEGADKLGKEFGVEIVPPEYFITEKRHQQWQKKMQEKMKGTVGCVALDKYGNIAAATSTGGLTGKMPGRVGDSPLINAGTYANNKTCGVSGTGTGELFINHTIAFNVSALMEYQGMTLNQAANKVVFDYLPAGGGGIIAVDKDGNYETPFNTSSMLRGAATSEGIFEVKIWK